MEENKVIQLNPAPIIKQPNGRLVLDLGIIVLKVLYEQGLISWEEYARAVSPEFCPAKYLHPPKQK